LLLKGDYRALIKFEFVIFLIEVEFVIFLIEVTFIVQFQFLIKFAFVCDSPVVLLVVKFILRRKGPKSVEGQALDKFDVSIA